MITIADLPAVNAGLNSLVTVLIIAGVWFIKNKREKAHKICMVAAVITSAIFLVSYLIRVAHAQELKFPTNYGDAIRYFYYVMLATHVILAMVIVPLVLMAVHAGWKDNRERHKKIVRWAAPIWLYVSVTGVLIYFFLYQWFPQ